MNLNILYFQKVFQKLKNQKFEERQKNVPFLYQQEKGDKKSKVINAAIAFPNFDPETIGKR